MFETIIFNEFRRKRKQTKNKHNSFPTSNCECIQIAKRFFFSEDGVIRAVDK